MIPYGRQSISEADIDAVVEILRSDFITQGPAAERFEEAVAEYCGVKHAIAVANGTAALHLACLGFGLGPGDLLWTSPNTFVASANCALYCGADVGFVDIDPLTYNMSVEALEEKLACSAERGRLPTVVEPVHFAGQSCDMARIAGLACEYGFRVLEDASHALGGTYRGSPIGSCVHSDAAVFSFHPVKIITTGEGGMVVTGDDEVAARVRLLRTHGITKDPGKMECEDPGGWYYEQLSLGYNFRITDLQCALGASQLDRLDKFVDRRNALAARYDEVFADLPMQTPVVIEDARSAYHLYVIRVPSSIRRRVYDEMRTRGVGVNVHYIPVHLQPYYRQRGMGPGECPQAEAYYEEALTLPLHPPLTEREQTTIIDSVVEILG